MNAIPGTDNDSSTADANGGPTLSNKVVDTQEAMRAACEAIARDEAGQQTEDGEGDAWIALRIADKIAALRTSQPNPAEGLATQCSGDTQELADLAFALEHTFASEMVEVCSPHPDNPAKTIWPAQRRKLAAALRTTHSPSEAGVAAIVHGAMVDAGKWSGGDPKPWQGGNSVAEDRARAAAKEIAALPSEKADAALWVSPGQLEQYLATGNPSIPPQSCADYLPARRAPEGLFTQPLYRSLPSDKTVELLREIKSKVAYHVENPSAWDTFDQGVSDLLGGIVRGIDSHLGEMK